KARARLAKDILEKQITLRDDRRDARAVLEGCGTQDRGGPDLHRAAGGVWGGCGWLCAIGGEAYERGGQGAGGFGPDRFRQERMANAEADSVKLRRADRGCGCHRRNQEREKLDR